MVPTLYGILVLLLGVTVSANGMVYLAVIATLFGATAAAFATALGGATVTPAVMVQMFVAFRILRSKGILGLLQPMEFLKPGFWLLLLTLWAAASAVILPRFFRGQFLVDALDRGATTGLQLIAPVSMNITQAMYAVLGLFTFVAMRATLQRPGTHDLLAKAILALASLNIVAALIDLAEYHAGLPPLLPYLKNATYVMMGGEVAGLMRISGTFAETSSFSQFTLTLLAFTHTLWINGVHRKWAAAVSIMSLSLLLISTSGTAYVGLGICFGIAMVFSVWYFMRHGDMGKYSLYLWMAVLGLIALSAVLLFVPPVLEAVKEFFGVVIGKKVESESGAIRFAMNARALDNFIDSFGLGTGLGSNRASSFALVVLSNLGWVGAVLMGIFLYSVQMGRGRKALPPLNAAVVLASRHAVMAALITACISGIVYDLGVLFYILAAAAVVPRPDEIKERGLNLHEKGRQTAAGTPVTG